MVHHLHLIAGPPNDVHGNVNILSSTSGT